MVQQHGLTWGALDFVTQTPAADGYLLEAIGGESNFGNPKAEIQIIRSLLTDGSLAVLEGWDNREVPIRLRLSAPDVDAGPALAAAESALMAEIQTVSKAPLIYTPPASSAAACVFDVVAATLERDNANEWDKEEKMREYRYFTLTLTCLPFARPEDTVVVPAVSAPPVTPAVTVVDACTSLTGWSAIVGTTSLVGSDGVRVSHATSLPSMRRSGSVSMTGTPYLVVQTRALRVNSGGPPAFAETTVAVDGVVLTPVATTGSISMGDRRLYFSTPAFTTLTFTITEPWVGGSGTPTSQNIEVYQIERTDSLPTAGSARQQSRTATVAGSAPTQAAIRLYDATPAVLGTEILVHSSRNTGWQPALRPFRTSSATVTADSAMVSGARNTLTSSMVFRMSADRFTEGTYSLMARMSVSTSAALGWSARMVSSAGATTVGSSVVVSGSTTVPVTSGYQVLNLAAIPLPVVKAEADQMVELTLTGTANMTLDEAWLFGLHDGVLTWIRDADSLTWIEIRSPELGAARPSIYGGTGAKGANSIDVSWKAAGSTYGSFGSHRFEPGLMQIFTVTSTSLVSQSEIEFYPRYHSHVEAA